MKFSIENSREWTRGNRCASSNARPFRIPRWCRTFRSVRDSREVKDRGSSEKSGSFSHPTIHFREGRLVLVHLRQGRCQSVTRFVILVASSSVSAFVRDDPPPSLHAVTRGSDKQETRDSSQGDGGGKGRNVCSVARVDRITRDGMQYYT